MVLSVIEEVAAACYHLCCLRGRDLCDHHVLLCNHLGVEAERRVAAPYIVEPAWVGSKPLVELVDVHPYPSCFSYMGGNAAPSWIQASLLVLSSVAHNTRAGIVQSRLDFFLISRHLNYQISDSNLKPGFKSDHSLIKLVVDLLHTQKRGKGYWKFNNSLLHDKTYVQLIKEELKILATNKDIQDKCCFWDFIKCRIRTLTISYCTALSRQNRKQEEILASKLESLEKKLGFRSKAQWVEHGEKNNKYFLNLEKRNCNLKYIKKLITDKAIELTEPDQILDEEKQFYKVLYTSKIKQCEDACQFFLKPESMPQLNEIDKQLCDASLKLEELVKAVKEFKK